MAADALEDGAQVVALAGGKLGQAQDQLAGFGRGEGRQGQDFEPGIVARRAVAGGEEEAAFAGGLAQID